MAPKVDPGEVEGTDLRVLKYPHPALRADNTEIEVFDDDLKKLARDMFKVGVGSGLSFVVRVIAAMFAYGRILHSPFQGRVCLCTILVVGVQRVDSRSCLCECPWWQSLVDSGHRRRWGEGGAIETR